MLYLVFSGVLLTHLRRPTGEYYNCFYKHFVPNFNYNSSGRLTVQEQKLEGDFRYVNSRLITNSEEVNQGKLIFSLFISFNFYINLNTYRLRSIKVTIGKN